METQIEATIEERSPALKGDDTDELVSGRPVHMPPTGLEHGYDGSEILFASKRYECATGAGYALRDNVGFIVNLPGRRFLGPDVALTQGDPRGHRESVVGALAAGTPVVWEVDLPTATIACYRSSQPDTPETFRTRDTADAIAALPGWRVSMREICR